MRFVPSLFVTVTLTLPQEKMLSGPAPTLGEAGMKPTCVTPSKPLPATGASVESVPFASDDAGVVSSVKVENASGVGPDGVALSRASSAATAGETRVRTGATGADA